MAVQGRVPGRTESGSLVTGSTVAVLIPWSDVEQDADRIAAFEYVCAWWARAHPAWPVIVGRCDADDGPWRKGLAVWRALCRASADVVVVADADVICANVGNAVDAVASGATSWSMPHRMVGRLTAESTAIVYQRGVYPPPPFRPGAAGMAFAEVHRGAPGGGMVVVRSDIAKRIPIDPRLIGWTHEDYAWSRALTMMAGHPHMGRELLYHHWHTPAWTNGAERVMRSSAVLMPSSAGDALWARYRSAPHAEAMGALCREAVEACLLLDERRSVRDGASVIGHDQTGVIG